jgi:hypothetical protein
MGCSSGAGSGIITPTPASSTAVLINMGDTPSDSVLAFAVTISAMSFTNTAGTTVTVPISTPMTMELAHLAGTVAPLTMPSITQGTYNSMSITMSSATVSYMASGATAPSQQIFSSPMTVSVPLSTPMTVGSNAMVMNLDLNLNASLGTAAGGGLTFSPTFKPTVEMATGASNATLEAGGMMHIVGSVSTTSGSTFTMGTPQGGSMSFTSGSGTQYMGMNGQTLTGSSMMSNSQILNVNATLQTNGTWMTNSITAMMASGGTVPMGIITVTTGSPLTGITMFATDGTGSGMMASYLASGITITIGSGMTYAIDDLGTAMTGLPFTPQFDATHMARGQNVAAAGSGGMSSTSGMMGNSGFMNMGGMTATGMELEPQGLTGTIANITSTGFALNLASGSAFTVLTGATSVTVYEMPSTQMTGLTLANGQTVEVNGFLFYNAGTYSFVATQMTAPPTP